MTRVSVDAEIDLALDVRAEDLADALIESVGQERALRMISGAKFNANGKGMVANLKDEAIDLINDMRTAFTEIDAGHAEKGMRALRLLCAEQVDLQQWQAIKDGKHPFLKLMTA